MWHEKYASYFKGHLSSKRSCNLLKAKHLISNRNIKTLWYCDSNKAFHYILRWALCSPFISKLFRCQSFGSYRKLKFWIVLIFISFVPYIKWFRIKNKTHHNLKISWCRKKGSKTMTTNCLLYGGYGVVVKDCEHELMR
jgi:hypothetical protein